MQPLGDLSQSPNFFYHSHISAFIFCHFYSSYTQILLLLAFCCLGYALSCGCPLLKGGVPVAAGFLAVANIPAVACFPAVAGMS
jgi:hypothetical protein